MTGTLTLEGSGFEAFLELHRRGGDDRRLRHDDPVISTPPTFPSPFGKARSATSAPSSTATARPFPRSPSSAACRWAGSDCSSGSWSSWERFSPRVVREDEQGDRDPQRRRRPGPPGLFDLHPEEPLSPLQRLLPLFPVQLLPVLEIWDQERPARFRRISPDIRLAVDQNRDCRGRRPGRRGLRLPAIHPGQKGGSNGRCFGEYRQAIQRSGRRRRSVVHLAVHGRPGDAPLGRRADPDRRVRRLSLPRLPVPPPAADPVESRVPRKDQYRLPILPARGQVQ